MEHSMNPQRGRHLAMGKSDENSGAKPHIFIHSHSNGHTLHAFHEDGTHEAHEHSDAQSASDHAHSLLGGEQRPEDHSHFDHES